jgi:hypothetical protein
MTLITFTLFFIDKRVGVRLFYLFALSSILNCALKNYFQLPRPCQIDPLVGLLSYHTQGFPSGAAQTAAIVAGVIWMETKKKFYRYVGLLFAIFFCFSRIYLGAHFFSDILGGLLVGSFLLGLYSYVFPWIEKKEKSRFLLFSLILALLFSSKFSVETGMMLGVAFGLLFERNNACVKTPWYYRAVWAVCGFTAFFLCMHVKHLYPQWKFFFSLAAGFCPSSCSVFLNLYYPSTVASETNNGENNG